MTSACARQPVFFPKADAAVLSCRLAQPPTYPESIGPVYDPGNVDTAVLPWLLGAEEACYPPQQEAYAPAVIPDKPFCSSDRYLRASLAKNERFRLSMLWYYTRDIFKEAEFLSGLQEKVCIAQETTGWEVSIVGILDVNFYTRLATVGASLGILPRGETLCAHTITQPPGSVFLLPNMLEDWRFAKSPYVESGGLRAYAGAPLRLQNESGDTACLGSLCVASPKSQEPLTRSQQMTLARLADWVVSDIVQLTRARRQRERRRMVDLIAAVQKETDDAVSEETLIQILRTTYPDALVALHSSKAGHIEAEGRGPVPLLDLSDGLWEDSDYIDEFIARSNHRELPTDRVVRIITAQCEGVSGQLYLTVATKDFRLVFDDIDAWFVQTCAGIVSRVWHRHLLAEVMVAKEKFLRGFSHQLRTPIHGILGSVELLAEDLKSRNSSATISQAAALLQATSVTKADGNHRIYLDTIKRAGRDLISIVNSMITLNRWADVAKTDRQYATYTIYELETELANKTQEAIAGDERYHASLFFNHNLPPDYCSLQTDLGLLRDSLLPVIINAIQSTMEGVVAVTISVRPNDNELVVDVTDTGHGIPHDDHQRIFELYEQVDVYSTGSGLGLTLASKFAALLDGSIDLISSEMGRGSHFRATFHNVELTHLQDEPTVSQLANLPQRFHPVSSGSKALSLCDHFAKFLTCHGFASSDDMNDSFVVVDFVADPEQRRTVLSQLPQDQVVICLVPFSEEESHIDDTLLNVVYVHSPFSTGTMSSALEHADSLMPRLKATLVDPVQATRGLVVLSKLDRSMNKTGLYSEIEDTRRVVGISDTNQASITHEEAIANQVHTAPESSKLVRPTHSENSSAAKAEVLADSLNFRTTQRPTRPNDDSLTNVHLDSATLAIAKTEQDAPLELEMSQSAQTFPDPANSSHPTALLVDDNVINLRVMQMYCDKRNLLYVCAKDGLEAVSVFASHQNSISCGSTKSPIQLILMDLQMPGCDGIEATRRIRRLEEERNWGKSVLFIVTGQDSPADRAGAESAGSQEFYVKPVGIKTYDAGLKQYFPRFEARSQLP